MTSLKRILGQSLNSKSNLALVDKHLLIPFFTDVNLLNLLRRNINDTQIVEIKIKYEDIQVHKYS